MPVTPFSIVGIWFRGLLSIAVIVGGIALLRAWYDDAHVRETGRPVAVEARRDAPLEAPPDGRPRAEVERVEDARPARSVFRPDFGFNRQTGLLAAAVALLLTAVAGRLILQGISTIALKPGDAPDTTRGGEVRRLKRPGGAELNVEMYGPADAPPIVLTHGWGADATEWSYLKRDLAGRFRLIAWDLPGLGLSKKPDDNDYRLETLARHLDAVVDLAGGRPVVLLGHSIGGMINLTYARIFPEALGSRVAGLAIVHSTYTNPVRTVKFAPIATALEGPLLVPLLHLTIALWPLVWLMNWLSYFNGSFHQQSHTGAYSGGETKGQLDFAAGFIPRARPDVVARGMFGMLAYDATAVPPTLTLPTLVVAADLDSTCLPEASERIAREAPGATLVTLAPARHMGLIEHHDRFATIVADFAGTCLGAGPVRPS